MKECCNNNCNQGRNCPAKNECSTQWGEDLRMVSNCAVAIVLIMLFSFIGLLAFVIQ